MAGSVIIGRREEGKEAGVAGVESTASPLQRQQQGEFNDEPDAPLDDAQHVHDSLTGGYRDDVELEVTPSKSAGRGESHREL